MRLLIVCLSALAVASSSVEVELNYHERVGIPLATRIKATEDEIIRRQTQNVAVSDDLLERWNQDGKIVGGAVAPANAYPYLAGLVITFVNIPGTSGCGSSLISSNRLVTAAHCWRDTQNQAAQFIVVLGSHYLFYGGTRIATSTVVMHPQWTPATIANDVAIIYLPTHVWFSQEIQPVALPHSSLWDSFDGRWALAAGYGKTSDAQAGISVNSVVSHVNLQVISVPQCQQSFPFHALWSNICTSGLGGVGICGGDSGGPLVVFEHGQPVLIGISSFVAQNNCQGQHPSAFARVTSFYSFIMQHM